MNCELNKLSYAEAVEEIEKIYPAAFVLLMDFFFNSQYLSWQQLTQLYFLNQNLPRYTDLMLLLLSITEKWSQKDNPVAQFAHSFFLRGKIMPNHGDPQKSFLLAEKSAAQNHPIGITGLGYNVYFGIGTEADEQKGFDLYTRASAFSYCQQNALHNLAFCLKNNSKFQDLEKSAETYKKAIELGTSPSAAGLGYLYYHGRNPIKQSYSEAVHWYKIAAERGDAVGMNNLGHCYERGFGTEMNKQLAIEMYQKAASLQSEIAKNHLARLGIPIPTTHLIEPPAEKQIKLFQMLYVRTFHTNSPFYKTYLPLDLFKLITREYMGLGALIFSPLAYQSRFNGLSIE